MSNIHGAAPPAMPWHMQNGRALATHAAGVQNMHTGQELMNFHESRYTYPARRKPTGSLNTSPKASGMHSSY